MGSSVIQGRPAAPAALDDSAMWAAVARRDAAADGRFVYAVRTTGVYCRPSCAARPRRENVRFHPTAAAAAAAGFRPCKRCRPERPDGHAGRPA
ncbi:Ada metal-binding domain-containing protein [Azospirillum sp. ST 5-10]|uniref:Ada metal-binding domain-containing protein n=1 Tax=unclassified Azospirillum TaxID=2630922 RepID=UPI003F4A747F